MAMIMAKDGHFASSIAAARLEKKLGKSFLGLSAHLPLSKLVSSLNSFSPMLMAPYASMASQFASEQEAGRLKIRPVLLTLSAEGLAQKEYSRIAKVFKAKVGNSYAASECPFLSYSCSHQWLHVNSDWVIIEPVDENYNIVPAGNLSHTVLITNLANKTQPILRYDIGDSVVLRPDACPCGNPFPAIQVKGRSADVLTFTTAEGEQVSIPPLAFTIQIDSIQGVERLQILQTEPDQVRVRLRFEKAGDKRAIVGKVQHAIEELFNERKLSHVSIVIGDESPEQSVGGKFREVIPLKAK
jgi:phenylacetate-coenzyme A ligase PaaK-like adenylate-forming protein